MNKRQQIVQEAFLNDEEKVIKRLKQVYKQSLKDINAKAKELQDQINTLDALQGMTTDPTELAKLQSMKQSKIYQKQYQDALKKQIGSILDNMQVEEFKAVNEYLNKCYEQGFLGVMYDLQGQGIPLIFPLDQEAMVRAVQLNSKIKQGYYARLGEDVALLKKKITAQVSRGISTGMTFAQVAQQLEAYTNIGFNNAVRIARTEGHRIQVQSAMDACYKAKEKGADVVKQWDGTLDGRTRPSHRKVDGEIRELDEPFSNGLMFPADPNGGAKEVINCRCALLQRAKWALDDEELETLKERAKYFGLDKTKNFEEFKEKYLKAAEETKQQERTFTGAKTIQEAEEFAKKFAESVSYSGLSLNNANIINQRLEELQAKYTIKKLEEIKVGSKGVMSANYRKFCINGKSLGKVLEDGHKNFLNNQEETRKSIKFMKDRFSGKKIPPAIQKNIEKLEQKLKFTRWGVNELYPDKVAMVVTHEYGHIIADQYFGQINKEIANPHLSLNWSLKQVSRNWDDVFKKAIQNGDVYKVSEYGSTNSHEFFAECFTMREYGEELPDYIESMMKGILDDGIL